MAEKTVRSRALPDLAATRALAEELAARARVGDVLALDGPLGVGKTAFARAFLRALAARENVAFDEEVVSPTFTLVQVYEIGTASVCHADLYRLEPRADVVELGLDEAFAEGITLIEWAERIAPDLPEDTLHLRFAFTGDDGAREVAIEGPERLYPGTDD